MDNMKFAISGFKCFKKNVTFDLNQMTLLTGANSGGKSSLIQALLLTKKVAYSKETKISFFDKDYALELGKYDEVICRDINDDVDMLFDLNGCQWKIRAEDVDDNDELIKFEIEHPDELRALFSKGFSFLAADREPPRYMYEYTKGNMDLCDCHGRNVGEVLNKHERDNIDPVRSLNREGNKLKILLDKWVEYIFPGIELMIASSATKSRDTYQIVEHGENAATNIGFGITYALPILINGLLLDCDGWLVVENPEAHLHPKAQSNMGYFLACMASAGVRVVVETHSEHVVNGVRRFLLKKDSQLRSNEIAIYFFNKVDNNHKIEKINVDEWGNLSDLPLDFFDQVRQDMQKIIQLGIERNHA